MAPVIETADVDLPNLRNGLLVVQSPILVNIVIGCEKLTAVAITMGLYPLESTLGAGVGTRVREHRIACLFCPHLIPSVNHQIHSCGCA